MNKIDKSKQVIKLRSAVDELIHGRYHKLAKKYNLSLEQFHLLIELDELALNLSDEMSAPTIGDIAKNINNSQNTVSEKVNRLEKKGLVRRVKSEEDRRVSRVVLTDKGRELINDISEEASSKFLLDSISALEESDIDNLINGLEKLYKKMRSE